MDLAEPQIVKRGTGVDVIHGDDRGLFVRFYYKPIQDEEKTTELGRPIFNDVAYVSIRIAGDKTTEVQRRATDDDKKRFERQWQAFKAESDQEILGGMPLKEWPQMTKSMILELNAVGVFTVEKFLELDDRFLSSAPIYRELQKKAQQFMGEQDQVSELEARIKQLEKALEESNAVGKPKGNKEKNDYTKNNGYFGKGK